PQNKRLRHETSFVSQPLRLLQDEACENSARHHARSLISDSLGYLRKQNHALPTAFGWQRVVF
ncbi:MAG: hypothetical protein RSB18_00240, partial [Clostridia bacterium]